MNRKESILYRTGQVWILWLMPLLVAIGILIVLIAVWIKGSGTNHWFLTAVGVSVCVEIAAFLIPAIAIRCPGCGAHWFWIAMLKQRSDSWFNWQFQTKCPICGFTKKPEKC